MCFFFARLVQVIAAIGSDTSSKRNDSEAIRALRAVRVLRPLKLVSGVPSMYNILLYICAF